MTEEQAIKKAIVETIGKKCELCGKPFKVFISYREQDGIVPLHLSIRVSCPFCESEVDECSGVNSIDDYYELNHLETGGTIHGTPAMTEI